MMMLLYSLKIYAFPWRRIGQNVVQIAEEKFLEEKSFGAEGYKSAGWVVDLPTDAPQLRTPLSRNSDEIWAPLKMGEY